MELPGKHRLVFDGTSPDGVKDALQFTGNFFTGNKNGYGLDANQVADRSTWTEPWLEPVGVDRVLVNGQTVVQNGKPTGVLPGKVLRPLA